MIDVLTKTKMTVKQIGERQVVTEDNLHQFIYKNIGLKNKLKTKVNKEYVKQQLADYDLIYHPMWLAKTIVIAERPPFPPKNCPISFLSMRCPATEVFFKAFLTYKRLRSVRKTW